MNEKGPTHEIPWAGNKLITVSTATSTVAATSPASRPSRSTGPTPPVIAGTRLVDIQRLAKEILSIQILDRCQGLSFVRHFHKPKPPRLAAIFVFNDVYGTYLAEGREGLADIFLCCFER
jgi:hypothetical protein